MSAPAVAWGLATAGPAADEDRPSPARHGRAPGGGHLVLLAGVLALAAALRLVALGRTPTDPFYDAAVRSMGTSWHALLVGAFDPSARLAIDKPPLDLWLQVASTKLLGFTPTALLLPEALGGIAAVALLYDLLRTLAGRRAALAGALALAVLPVAVITSRSDTMDSVMAALVVGAFAVAARGLRTGRGSRTVVAGALLGAAFEVKLFEALVAAAPLAAMWWWGACAPRRARLTALAGGAAALAVVALAWLAVVTTVVAPAQRPWAFGSTTGSPWQSTFVDDGWQRLTGSTMPPPPPPQTARAPGPRAAARLAAARRRTVAEHRAALRRQPAPAGPLRLLSAQDRMRTRLGVELAGAWAAVLAAAIAGTWRRRDRAGRAGMAALAAWLALGTVLFSAQGLLRPRYLEAFDPAVAGCLGAGIVLACERLRGARTRSLVPALALAAVLAVPMAASAQAVARHVQDSGTPGALPARRLADLTAYLRTHQGGARYETASVAVAKAGAVIAHDGRPVLMLTASWGRPLVTTHQLARLVATGQVHTALVGDSCTAASPDRWAGCSAAARWIRAHGVDVSRQAHQPHLGLVYALLTRSGTR